MAKFLITGGRQRRGAKGETEWFSYKEALAFLIDTDDQSVSPAVSYVSPSEHRPEDQRSNVVFKAGTATADRVYICTQTEVLTFSMPGFELVDCLSHPWFNDLHHVVPNAAGNFLVAVTGLDLVVEITPKGEILREWPTLEDNTWERFDRNKDYRKVVSTKPHHAHPNYVFEWEGEVWATRLYQHDAICLTSPERKIESQAEKLHDGVVRDGLVYFTSVDGHLIVADLATGKTIEVYDFNAMTDSNQILGWCRGIHLLDEDRILVGFSRIRPSRIRENVGWIKFHMGIREDAGRMGTRVSCYNLRTRTREWDLELEKHGLNAVFSIIPVD